jgi:hypothetical protein
MEDRFYSVVIDSAVAVSSTANIYIEGMMTCRGDIVLRPNDTVFVLSALPSALAGQGMVSGGTILRATTAGQSIGSTEPYQFESKDTYVQFHPSGGAATRPSQVSVTTHVNAPPQGFGEDWVDVHSRVNTKAHTVIADTIRGFSVWAVRVKGSESGPDAFVRRVYAMRAEGGEGYTASLSLRYDLSEIPQGAIEDSLQLCKLEEVVGADGRDRNTVYAPDRFELLQNFPNPFNSTTTIIYQIPTATVLRLLVYDMLGREVAVVVDGKRESGRHTVRFEATNLPSGVYVYRFTGSSFTQARKMVVIR